MSNARENRIKQLEEQVKDLQAEIRTLVNICDLQKGSIASQQEALTQMNICHCSTMACLTNIHGELVTLEDGTQARRVKIPESDFWGVLDNFDPHAVLEDGYFVITVAPKPQVGEEPHETKSECGCCENCNGHQEGEYEAVAKTERPAD